METKTDKSNFNWLVYLLIGGLIYWGYNYFSKPKLSFEEKLVKASNYLKADSIGQIKTYSEQNLKTLVSTVDIQNETTNDFAVRLASKFPGEYNIGQICQIYDYIVSNWKYVNDSDKKENFRSASRTIKNNFAGDCDDFAILIAAMIESIGGDARISLAYNDKGEGHAFTEVLASNSQENLQAIVDNINAFYSPEKFEVHFVEYKNGECWLNLDWFGQPQHPGGQYFEFTKRTIYYPTANPPKYVIE